MTTKMIKRKTCRKNAQIRGRNVFEKYNLFLLLPQSRVSYTCFYNTLVTRWVTSSIYMVGQ